MTTAQVFLLQSTPRPKIMLILATVMKILYQSLIVALLFLLGGCIRENNEDCPVVGSQHNVTLMFRYLDDSGSDVFPQEIDKVDLFVFDANGRFVRRVQVLKAELNTFQGVIMELDPGTYRIVCWGNASSRTQINEPDINSSMKDFFIYFTGSDSADPLYYSVGTRGAEGDIPYYTLEVPANRSVAGIIDFTSQYNVIEVYVKGFSDSNNPGRETTPDIEVRDLTPGYYFDMEPLKGQTKSFEQASEMVATPQGIMAGARFYTPDFNEDNQININIIKNSTGETVATVNLREFLIQNDIHLDGRGVQTIRIYIEFKNGNVYITIPEWDSTEVVPEV